MLLIIFKTIVFYLLNIISKNNIFLISIWSYGILSNTKLYYLLIISLVIILLEYLISFISIKKPFINNPKVIINNGKINFKSLNDKYNTYDLVEELKNNGIKSISDVKLAILDDNKLKFKLYSSDLPVYLILDGKINYDNLNSIDKNTKWLLNILKDKNIKLKNISYAYYKDDKCYIIKN